MTPNDSDTIIKKGINKIFALGDALNKLGLYEQAIICYDQAL